MVGAVGNLVLMLRWRRRHREELAAVGYYLRRVHKVVRAGGPVAEGDRSAAVLDVEMHVLTLPNVASMLILACSIAVNPEATPAATTLRYALGGCCVVLALAASVVIARYVLVARQQCIRPRLLWT